MEDYAGNTRKEREGKSQQKQKPEKVVVEKVIVGEVIQRPKRVGRKFKEVFLGGDARQAAGYVMWEVFLPALRNVAFDVIKGYAERVIYGESSSRRRGPIINYRSQYQGSQYSRPFERDPRERSFQPAIQPRERQNRHDINDIVLGDKEEADLVTERLADIMDKYDVVQLADLYALLGLQTSPIDFKWGWTYLGNIDVRQIRQGYLLILPPLEEI